MKCCMPHWEALRTAISARGLSGFVASNSDELAEKVEHHAEVGDDAEAFDPLLHAYMTIVMNALQQGGTYLLDLNEEGEPYCPLCELEKYYPGQNGPDLWISTAAEEQLARARELKLVAGVQ